MSEMELLTRLLERIETLEDKAYFLVSIENFSMNKALRDAVKAKRAEIMEAINTRDNLEAYL